MNSKTRTKQRIIRMIIYIVLGFGIAYVWKRIRPQ